MIRGRSARSVSAAGAVILIGVAAVLIAQPLGTGTVDPGGPKDRVVLVVEDRVSFEELMSVGLFRTLASRGAGLMTTYTGSGSSRLGPGHRADPYVIEWGTTDVPRGGGVSPLRRALDDAGISVCSFFGTGTGGAVGLFALAGDHGQMQDCPHDSPSSGRRLVVVDDGATMRADLEAAQGRPVSGGINAVLEREAGLVEKAILETAVGAEIAVVVVTPSTSFEMDRRGDEVTPLIHAVGSTDMLVGSGGGTQGLTSDTTRQAGLVANVDVAPTILRLFGLGVPTRMTGSPIRVDETVDVFHLHQLHLDQRRIRLPFQLALIAFVSVLAILTIVAMVLLKRGALPPAAASVLRFICLFAVALLIPLMAGGLLPRLTYWVVVPFVVVTTLALAAVAWRARWPGPLGPFAFLGAVAVAFMVVDSLFGWRGLRIPLMGGTMFDGARFYGTPNIFLSTLLASTLFLASLLGPWAGVALLFGAGLFAGFPSLGADLGGSATLFLAAGLWWGIRSRGRPALRVLAIPGTVIAGVAVVVLANQYLPGAPTHIAGFVERGGGGLSGLWDAFTRRLDVGIGQLRDVPAAWLALLGLPAVLIIAIVRPPPLRSGLELAGVVWRDVLIVLTLAAVASFFANDTGVAAAAPAFLYAGTATLYPVYLWASRR